MKLRERISQKSTFSFPLVISLGPSDFWVMVFICCLSLFMTKLIFTIPVYLLFKIRVRIKLAKNYKFQVPKEMEQIVLYIQSNKLQSLSEAIELNPRILHCDYKKQTLLSWCKFYNNTKALMVVLQLIKKYPPEKVLTMVA